MKHSHLELEPSFIVIFGITGDLAQRHLLPALYHLMKDGLLHKNTEIIGVTRQDITAAELLERVELCINEVDNICDPEALKLMNERTSLFKMNLTDDGDYAKLLNFLNDREQALGICINRLYYLAIPPQVYNGVVARLGAAGLNTSCPHGVAATRLLIEKPFGYDSDSAKALLDHLRSSFSEEQIFRIDHYLAKETVQNILVFRFQNPIFEAIWSNQCISHIEIMASEKIGIENRALFYEPLGALRDFIQSHLLQLMAIVTMDRPEAMTSQAIHEAKQSLLKQVPSISPDQVEHLAKRGQYNGYREEVNNPHSVTETFAAIQIEINSQRWRGTPITLWTGKGLSERKTEIHVSFKSQATATTNTLCFRIQPNEGIELDLLTKEPGFDNKLRAQAMDFSYRQNANGQTHPNAYERVLVDAVRGDHTLFATGDEVLEAWRIIQPVLAEWAKRPQVTAYQKGAEGSALCSRLID